MNRVVGEFGLIENLARLFGPTPAEVALGIGDDGAALAAGGDRLLVLTMDTLVEGVHFDLAYISLAQLGRKSLAVNVSDIAAMGGEPAYALLSLGWPPARKLEEALEFGEGLAAAGREFGVAVIGGDTVASPQGLTVTLTVLGWGKPGALLRRNGARPGDQVYVTGPLGESAAGLEVLRRGLTLNPVLAAPLIEAHLHPRPRVAAGRLLADEGLASAAIDLSDGLAGDLNHVCRASGTGAVVLGATVPITVGVAEVARLLGADPLTLALEGGEDYELLFTSPPERAGRLFEAFFRAGLSPPVLIGEITAGSGVTLRTSQGDREISGGGFDHFRAHRRQA
ncbi:MAG: thiamine-phosphate kinase [Deltaproteobacteria bacterium]|nr:thiamine-phosphate kinase [Deltaproteobacteria bacterium]